MIRFRPTRRGRKRPTPLACKPIGLSVAKGFDWQALDEPSKRGLSRSGKAAEQIVDAKWAATGETTNGWRYTMSGGRAGYDFALRAALAKNQSSGPSSPTRSSIPKPR